MFLYYCIFDTVIEKKKTNELYFLTVLFAFLRVLSKKATSAKPESQRRVKSPARPPPDGGFTPLCVALLLKTHAAIFIPF